MRLAEAITLSRGNAGPDAPGFTAFLACGFTPLHLQTYLKAHLRTLLPAQRVEIAYGLYGDLLGNLELGLRDNIDCCVLQLEWADLDPRLGLRNLAGWRPDGAGGIGETARMRLDLLRRVIGNAPGRPALIISQPTLPLPPIESLLPMWKGGTIEVDLYEALASFVAWAASQDRVRLVSANWLARQSAPAHRLDVKSEMLTGFPYSTQHTDVLAMALARLIQPPAPKKGLITDLDNTLWKGILGEVGISGICWDLDRKGHVHAMYQELLRSLADTGVLIAAASKNDAENVNAAFSRADLILDRGRIYPFEVHWEAKSQSVARILKTWNIGADSVVFVDDNPVELAEVKATHPQVECLQFPESPDVVYALLENLRSLFAKPAVTEADKLRLSSLRAGEQVRENAGKSGAVSEEFLASVEGVIQFSSSKSPLDPRVLELINKTNQFNLNGKRYTEAGLRRYLETPRSVLLKVSYSDKFGPLGKIAMALGRVESNVLILDSWVISCRAFSRRIEYASLEHLFYASGVDLIEFRYAATEKNGPLTHFLAAILGQAPEPGCRLSLTEFREKCPALFHRVEEEVNG